MGRMTNSDSGGRQENKRWSLIHGSRFLTILLVISMIHVAASQNKMSTLDQGLNKIRSPRYVKTAGKTNTQSSRRTAAEKYITDLVKVLGGNTSIVTKVKELLDFEAKLKEVKNLKHSNESSMTNLTLDQLQQKVPQFNWSKHLNQMFAPHNITGTEIIHAALPYLKKTMELIQNASKSVLANYLVWHVIKKEVAYSSFNKKVPISIAKRKEQCVDETESTFMDLIQAAYVTTYGKRIKRIKNMVEELTNAIRQALKRNVNHLIWVDAESRKKINEKIDNMRNEIGFPDYLSSPERVKQKFKKYDTLTLKKDEYFKNKIALSKFNHLQMLMKFRQPVSVDHGWPVFAHEGEDGARYIYDTNFLVQPLTSLRPPFFYESEYLRAVNFGAMGANIGKSITLAFGLIGRKYDKNGLPFSTGQGWSRRSLRNIEIKGRCFIRQYSQYKLFGRWQVDGKHNYLDENIDTDGLKAANKAYHDWAQQNPSKTWLLPELNLTNEQLFYTAFAQTYCRKGTPDGLHKAFIKAGSYDDKFGVIGALCNSCEFANAFKCKKYSPMNPPHKCNLWSKDGNLY
ncbi:endothelin-converting enzyme homolog [Actinia tenebrosa]|uniref:Endothelin-converting enzyme homolog n=1 Tax=Actinia tenebrosa TaxID=6105 RepID=A0A6P8HLN2_ACTTE|nr:endothelin-converting enzyme homolog [Actinia tenebrosa]